MMASWKFSSSFTRCVIDPSASIDTRKWRNNAWNTSNTEGPLKNNTDDNNSLACSDWLIEGSCLRVTNRSSSREEDNLWKHSNNTGLDLCTFLWIVIEMLHKHLNDDVAVLHLRTSSRHKLWWQNQYIALIHLETSELTWTEFIMIINTLTAKSLGTQSLCSLRWLKHKTKETV